MPQTGGAAYTGNHRASTDTQAGRGGRAARSRKEDGMKLEGTGKGRRNG